MKGIFAIVLPHWKRIALAGICSLVVSAMNGSFAYITEPIVDEMLIKGHKVAFLAAAIFAIFLTRGLFRFFQNFLMISVGAKIVRDLRNRLYGHMVYLPMSRFGTDSTGAMMSRVINDAGVMQEFLAFRVKDLFVSSGTIVFLTGVAFYQRWDLTLIAFAVLPAAFFTVGKLGRRLRVVAKRAQQKISEITESLSEGLAGIKIIKAFSTEGEEMRRVEDKNQEYYREVMRSTRISEATGLIMDFVAGSGIALIIFYGTSLISSGEMTTGEFFSLLMALVLIYTPAKRLAQVNMGFQMAIAVIGRIDEAIAFEKEPDGTVELGQLRENIEYRNVFMKYPGRQEDALYDINLKVNKGEMLAVVGRSGSGKTTMVDLLARFHPPTSGAIYIDGVDTGTATLRSLRSQIGIVSQDVILFNDSVKANIAYGRDVSDSEVVEAAKAAHAHEFIEALPQGYDTPIGQRGILLSGGQRQRISIARAIINDPPILVLDEATSSLDTQSEMIVQRALDELMEKGAHKRTTFVIAHRLSTIKRAERIVILDRRGWNPRRTSLAGWRLQAALQPPARRAGVPGHRCDYSIACYTPLPLLLYSRLSTRKDPKA
jgi:subfamily B ATP-binding cassette protein MsbA